MRRLSSALAALFAVLLVAAPSAGAASGLRADDFSLKVRAGGATAASADRPWTSPVLRAPKRFDVFGLRWRRAAGEVHIEVRTQRRGKRWTRWVETGHAHSPHGGDPVWAGGADRLQIRLSRRVAGLKVHFVRVTGTPKRAPRARAAQLPGQPAIIPRSEWGASQCKPRGRPSIGRVQMAFVHHTVGTNNYSRSQSASVVLGICRFHRNGNGWDDIGYNFLVDKYGQIFEGRAGGIDQAVMGAQAQGFNAESTGVANLGTYEDVPQSDAALSAMGRLLAWKLPLHGAPVEGEVVVKSAGGETNRYPSGRKVTFDRISGHRDGNSTECPGDALYAQLPRIRDIAANRAPDVIPPGAAPPVLTMEPVARSFLYPSPVRVAGRLTDSAGNGMGGQAVKVQIATSKAWRTQARTTTAGDGSWSAEVPATRTWAMRAVAAGVTSPKVRGVVAPAITARAGATRIRAGRRVRVRGTLKPARPRVVLVVARKVGKRYVRSFALRRKARKGRFNTLVTLRRAGLYRIRVRFQGDRRNGSATAPGLFVRATTGPTGGTAARAAR